MYVLYCTLLKLSNVFSEKFSDIVWLFKMALWYFREEQQQCLRLWVKGDEQSQEQLVYARRTSGDRFVAYWTPPHFDPHHALRFQVIDFSVSYHRVYFSDPQYPPLQCSRSNFICSLVLPLVSLLTSRLITCMSCVPKTKLKIFSLFKKVSNLSGH